MAVVLAAIGIAVTGWFAARLLFGGMSVPLFAGPLANVLAALLIFAPFAATLALRRPVVFPLAIYVLMVPFENLLHLPGGGTMPKLIAMSAAAVLGFSLLRTGRFVVPDRAVLVWALFVLWTIIAISWTIDMPGAMRNTEILLQLFLFYALIAIVPTDEHDLRILVAALILSGIGAAADGVLTYRDSLSTYGSQLGRVSQLNRVSLSIGSIDPNHFAEALQAPMAFLVLAVVRQRRIILKAVLAACGLVILTGILVTGSRAGLVSLGIALAYIGWKSRYRLQLALVAIPGIAVAPLIPTVWARFQDPSQGDASGRFEIWRVAIASFKEHWLLGTGTGSFHAAYENAFLSVYQPLQFYTPLQDSHNIVLFAGVECGIIGVALLLCAWFFQFRMLRHVRPSDRFYDLRVAAEAATIALFAGAMTLDMMYYKYLWLVFSIAALTRTASLQEAAHAAPRSATASAPIGDVVVTPRRARAARADRAVPTN
jgi:O-antigen ligase